MLDNKLTRDQIDRYNRQLLLPEFGLDSQVHLLESRVLVVGAGGLGCPAALYLAGAGVGVLGLVDRPDELVEKSNLHRQIAHTEHRVGQNKVKSAQIAIEALNSSVCVETHDEIVPANAVQLVSKYHLVLDCTDNVKSRYLINDACAAARVPLLSGAAIGLEGQLTLYCSGDDTPCYRCIFPTPPPPSCVGSCDTAGVLGPVPGIIGTLQALEALKLLAKAKNTSLLESKLLLFDATNTSFRTVKLRPRVKTCAVCGDNPSVNVATFDYDAFAAGSQSAKQAETSLSAPSTVAAGLNPSYRITVEQLAEIRKDPTSYRLIDVRPKSQFDISHLEEAENHPVSSPETFVEALLAGRDDRRTILMCRRGNSSQKALNLALKNGVTDVVDVKGGLTSWQEIVDQEFVL